LDKSGEFGNDCDLAIPGKLAAKVAIENKSIIRRVFALNCFLPDRHPGVLAGLPFPTCMDLEFRILMKSVKLSPSFGIASPGYISRSRRYMRAFGSTHIEIVRNAISIDGQICTETHFLFS
jgi:hypothetical protein